MPNVDGRLVLKKASVVHNKVLEQSVAEVYDKINKLLEEVEKNPSQSVPTSIKISGRYDSHLSDLSKRLNEDTSTHEWHFSIRQSSSGQYYLEFRPATAEEMKPKK